jgi:hypothetical protein
MIHSLSLVPKNNGVPIHFCDSYRDKKETKYNMDTPNIKDTEVKKYKK